MKFARLGAEGAERPVVLVEDKAYALDQITADLDGDFWASNGPARVAIASWVNGKARQASNTADMIFDVATIVYELSQYLVLEPGDLICTGTPEGVALSGRFPYLSAGDLVELTIDGLGRQRQRFVNA